MKKMLLLTSAAVVALGATTASAQVYQRDHRGRTTEYVPSRSRVPARPGFPARRLVIENYGPQSGMPGTLVTIEGRGFSRGTQVAFGNTMVAPTSLTRTSISFVVPRGAVDGTIQLQPPNTDGFVRVGFFEVVAPPRGRGDYTRPSPYDDDWRRTRSSRRSQRLGDLQRRWERAFLRSPQVQDELSLHARRIARLERMDRLASSGPRAHLNVRISRAIARENLRHERRMNQLELAFHATRPGRRFG